MSKSVTGKKRKSVSQSTDSKETETVTKTKKPRTSSEHDESEQNDADRDGDQFDAQAISKERNSQLDLLKKMLAKDPAPRFKAPRQQDEAGPEEAEAPVERTRDKQVRFDSATASSTSRKEQETDSAAGASRKKRKTPLVPVLEKVENPNWKPVQRYVPGETATTSTTPLRAQDASVGDAQPTSVDMTSLKEMFKPQETSGGFSLSDALNTFELEEEAYVAPVQAPPVNRTAHPPVRSQPTVIKPHRTAMDISFDASTTLFFPLDLAHDDIVASLSLSPEQKAALEAQSWTSGTFSRFRKTGTSEEIQATHEERRGRLTDQVRKRHREAVRKVKRRPVTHDA